LSIWMWNAKAICWAIRGQPQLSLRASPARETL
jgi:hypothetical protein